MKEIVPVTFDDLDLAESGSRLPADVTVIIALRIGGKGWSRELDLSDDHVEELEEFLERYRRAGIPAGIDPSAPGPRILSSGRQPMDRDRAADRKKLRKWASSPPDGGPPLSYHTSTGGAVYYSPQLLGAWEAFKDGDPHWRKVYDEWQPVATVHGRAAELIQERRTRLAGQDSDG